CETLSPSLAMSMIFSCGSLVWLPLARRQVKEVKHDALLDMPDLMGISELTLTSLLRTSTPHSINSREATVAKGRKSRFMPEPVTYSAMLFLDPYIELMSRRSSACSSIDLPPRSGSAILNPPALSSEEHLAYLLTASAMEFLPYTTACSPKSFITPGAPISIIPMRSRC